MASRLMSDLHPKMQPLLEKFLLECKKEGIDILVTCTYRSPEEQDALYAQGRTKPGNKVTQLQGGQSKHNNRIGHTPASLAFDVVPLRHGRAVWGTEGEDGELWQRLGLVGESVGLTWGGRWKMRDMPHFQIEA